SRLRLVDGAWAGDGEALVHAGAADELGLAPGDPITLAGTAFTVSGTWRAADRLDPRWLGDPVVETGRSTTAIGPVVVPESAWTTWTDEAPLARWTLVPDLSAAQVTDLDRLESAWRTLHRGWEGDED